MCMHCSGGATLSVTFAGQPVKGTKRILTTENKSSFQNQEKFTTSFSISSTGRTLCEEERECLNNKCWVQKKSPGLKNAFCLLFCRGAGERGNFNI